MLSYPEQKKEFYDFDTRWLFRDFVVVEVASRPPLRTEHILSCSNSLHFKYRFAILKLWGVPIKKIHWFMNRVATRQSYNL